MTFKLRISLLRLVLALLACTSFAAHGRVSRRDRTGCARCSQHAQGTGDDAEPNRGAADELAVGLHGRRRGRVDVQPIGGERPDHRIGGNRSAIELRQPGEHARRVQRCNGDDVEPPVVGPGMRSTRPERAT